jgi:hypothetical protein
MKRTVYIFVCLFSRTTCICLLALNWYLVFTLSANTSPNSRAVSLDYHNRHQHQKVVTAWTVQAQILSQLNFLDINWTHCSVAILLTDDLTSYILGTFIFPHQLLSGHLQCFITSIKSKAQGNCRTAAILILAGLLTYLLTPWSTVLLEKLTGSQIVKKFPAFDGTRRFITAFTQVPATCPYP